MTTTTKRLRRRVKVERRLYKAVRVYADSRALAISVTLHQLVIAGFERRGLSLSSVLDQGGAGKSEVRRGA